MFFLLCSLFSHCFINVSCETMNNFVLKWEKNIPSLAETMFIRVNTAQNRPWCQPYQSVCCFAVFVVVFVFWQHHVDGAYPHGGTQYLQLRPFENNNSHQSTPGARLRYLSSLSSSSRKQKYQQTEKQTYGQTTTSHVYGLMSFVIVFQVSILWGFEIYITIFHSWYSNIQPIK